MKKLAITLLCFSLYGCGNRIKQEVEYDTLYSNPYYSTKIYLDGYLIKEYADDIDSVTPELKLSRVKQGEQLLKNFK